MLRALGSPNREAAATSCPTHAAVHSHHEQRGHGHEERHENIKAEADPAGGGQEAEPPARVGAGVGVGQSAGGGVADQGRRPYTSSPPKHLLQELMAPLGALQSGGLCHSPGAVLRQVPQEGGAEAGASAIGANGGQALH